MAHALSAVHGALAVLGNAGLDALQPLLSLVTRIIVTGDGALPLHVHQSLWAWHGPLERVQGPDLTGVDLVVALPGDTEADVVLRARRAGVRVVEVVG